MYCTEIVSINKIICTQGFVLRMMNTLEGIVFNITHTWTSTCFHVCMYVYTLTFLKSSKILPIQCMKCRAVKFKRIYYFIYLEVKTPGLFTSELFSNCEIKNKSILKMDLYRLLFLHKDLMLKSFNADFQLFLRDYLYF